MQAGKQSMAMSDRKKLFYKRALLQFQMQTETMI